MASLFSFSSGLALLMVFSHAIHAQVSEVPTEESSTAPVTAAALPQPKCKKGFVHRTCPLSPSSCPATCDHVTGKSECMTGLEGCKPGCYCTGGKVMNAKGKCVNMKMCLAKKGKKKPAKKPCPMLNSVKLAVCKKMETAVLKKACRKANMVMCTRDGMVKERQCNSTHCRCVNETGEELEGTVHMRRDKSVDCLAVRAGVTCPAGKRYLMCQPKCPATCPKVNQTLAMCKSSKKDTCEPGCYCPRGTLMDSDESCVRRRSCGKAAARLARKKKMEKARKVAKSACNLKRLAEMKMCMLSKDVTRKQCMKKSSVSCGRNGEFLAKQCEGMNCHCADKNGVKMSGSEHMKKNCSVDCMAVRAGVTCPAGKRYLMCQPKCPATCPKVNQTLVMCKSSKMDTCEPGCYCPRGTLMDDDGSCVRRRSCGKAAARLARKKKMEEARKAKEAKMTPCRQQRKTKMTECLKKLTNVTRVAKKRCAKNLVSCDKKGKYAAKQCRMNGECVCYSENGVALPGSLHTVRGKKRKNVDCLAFRAGVTCPMGQRYMSCQPKSCPTTCSHVRNDSQCTPMANNATCAAGCYCPKGRVLDEHGRCLKPTKRDCQVLSSCQSRRLMETRDCKKRPMDTCNAIVCDKDGSYRPKQCYRLAKLCHCVNDSGELIAGSTHATSDTRQVDCNTLRMAAQ